MTVGILLSALKTLATSQAKDAASAARAMRFDLSRTESMTTPNGYVVIHDVQLPDVSHRFSLGFDPVNCEWTMTDLEPLSISVDPNQHWGVNQTINESKTGLGYAIMFDAPAMMTATASSEMRRLQTMSVRLKGA